MKNKAESARALLIRALIKQKKDGLIALLAGLGWVFAMAFGPLFIEAGVDDGILKRNLKEITLWSLVIIIVGLFQGGCSAIRRYRAFSMSYKAETELRKRLFAHLQRLHMAFHDTSQTGQLMSRAASDLQQISNFYVNLPITISSILIMLISISIMFSINFWMALIALSVLPLLGISTYFFSKKTSTVTLELQQELGKMATRVEESVAGVRAVKGFGLNQILKDKVQINANGIYEKAVRLIDLRTSFNPLQVFFGNVTLAGVLFYGGYQIIDHKFPIGGLIAFLAYISMLNVPINLLSFTISIFPRAKSAAERVGEILNLSPIITDPPNPVKLPDSGENGASIEFQNVDFSYQDNQVLCDFNLKIEPGDSVALVGPTGCGKTTVAKLLMRFYDVDSGSILVNGCDIKKVKLNDLRKKVGIVFQETFLFSDTVRANISFSEPEADISEVEYAAQLAGAHEFISQLPHGYDTNLAELGLNLSGGQRQRIALARAILGHPDILILDDATSAVDAEKELDVIKAMSQIMKNRTTLLIAHRVSTISLANKVALIIRGKVEDLGTHYELLDKSELYRNILQQYETKVSL
jgi:ATP-binding cassette subfamily B protein